MMTKPPHRSSSVNLYIIVSRHNVINSITHTHTHSNWLHAYTPCLLFFYPSVLVFSSLTDTPINSMLAAIVSRSI